jgi:hypothetical protein
MKSNSLVLISLLCAGLPLSALAKQKCEYRSDDTFVAFLMDSRAAQSKENSILKITTNKVWHACAQASSTLDVKFFVGKTDQEAKNSKKPVFEMSGLEKSNPAIVQVPRKLLCDGGTKSVAYKITGTGEMKVLNSNGMKDAACF